MHGNKTRNDENNRKIPQQKIKGMSSKKVLWNNDKHKKNRKRDSHLSITLFERNNSQKKN